MFSCCALFNTDDNAMDDMEHLKALEELEMESAARLSMTVDDEGRVDAKELDLEVTPMTARLETSTGTTEAPKFASLEGDPMVEGDTLEMKLEAEAELLSQQQQERQQKGEKAATVNKGAFFANERGDVEARATAASSVDVSKAEDTGTGVESAKGEMVTADADVGTGGPEIAGETLRALREAEDAAHAAAAEAKKRRFEEEASARAAREAESEAKKALWRAEEAQRMKEKAGMSSPSELMITKAVVKGEKAAPVASREREEEAARSAEAAREYVAAQLLNAKGLRLLKHGRNGKSKYRKLVSPDGDCRTISWGKESHDLKTMQEARKGTDDDPAYPGFKGTTDLRKSKTASGAVDRSFSLVFSSRSLDFTAESMEECDKLIQGFRALSAKAQQG